MLRHTLPFGLFWLSLPAWSAAEPPEPPPPAASTPPAPIAPAAGDAAALAPAGDSSLPNLSFQVFERGTAEPWILQIDNQGPSMVALVADPRLLWFEVQLPDGKAPHVCRLPKPLWPEFAVRETRLLIPPGQSYRRAFDPRFFCFASIKQTELVPNAHITPRFGWPDRTRVSYKRGKRVEEVLPAEAPFVAWMPSPIELGPKPKPGVDPAIVPWVEPTEGLKNLVGTPFTLGAQYASWASPPKADADSSLAFEVLEAKDAEDERASTVTLGLTNNSKRDLPVYVRQELITYFVSGPDGSFECSSSSPSPLPQDETAFTALKPGKTLRIVTRLLEVCARGRFGRPGLYQISAEVNVPWSGQKLGIDGFQGTLITPHSALLRVRSGERSFFIDRNAAESEEEAQQRASATTGGAASSPEQPPSEQPAPNDGAHEDGMAPEEAPMPDDAVE